MSIVFLQGPATGRLSLPPHPQLAIDLIQCDTLPAIVGGLHLARCQRAPLVVLDPGPWSARDRALHAAALRDALDALDAPYIEMHDHSAQEFAHWAHPQHAALAVFNVDRDAPARRTMALAVAARLVIPSDQAH
ncbi:MULTISPECIES: hypothetical protein [Pseudoxanthomonas]|jgi:hypothetical protein|uniref:3-dehydroquinate dehydratase n=1 Tax=Pseudoxanthomonas winnipegensis TaxID=2480810 RepID=A0A4Q8LAT5_9GAMM|nr:MULTISPECIES: hypothetical protein [Pseudoxanthomonas]TAA25761.1 hypothetical protein EA660_10010 [Pseudoxanthomonas winnipegensis]TMN18294.1 hypothetical protein FF950_15070 [Pseudoxanthomonas sp. X-1]UAY74747.1 hypothetical protein LAJ50_00225 [Pseudoxanthomonas sp. X-1]